MTYEKGKIGIFGGVVRFVRTPHLGLVFAQLGLDGICRRESHHAMGIDSVVIAQGQEHDMSYRLVQIGNRWKIFDVVIEGVNVTTNYRSQFNQLLHGSNPDVEALLVKMQDKVNSQQ